MAESRKEVVRAAIQLERDGRDFYMEAAAKSGDALARKMFESLADDELDHIDWIRALEPGVGSAEAANRDLYARLRHIFVDVPEAALRQLAASEGDVRAIDGALVKERESVAAYESWSAEAADAEVRRLCTTIAGIERFHVQVLMNTLEYFEHTPDWFMKEEHWNFEGA